MSTTYGIPGAVLTEREHGVPLVHGDPQRGSISVFTREVAAPDGGERPSPVFLQGGPGFEATRPTSPPSGWLARALADFRVLLDQRGTGRSTPGGSVIPGATRADQAEYLTHFRADAIVRDLELIRAELGVERWSLLGQSLGGFTSLTDLSLAPEGLREVLARGIKPRGCTRASSLRSRAASRSTLDWSAVQPCRRGTTLPGIGSIEPPPGARQAREAGEQPASGKSRIECRAGTEGHIGGRA
jgi:pimeloyl-ACP methyl ester carboxylesterase